MQFASIKKHKTHFLISFLIVLNIISVYRVFVERKEVTLLSQKIISLKTKLGLLNHDTELLKRIRDSNIVTTNNSRVSLIILFPDKGCIKCLTEDIQYVNRLKKLFKDHVTVYSFGSARVYLKKLGAEFNYINYNGHLTLDRELDNPFAFVVDKYGVVHEEYKSQINDSDNRKKFYNNVASLLEAIYNN